MDPAKKIIIRFVDNDNRQCFVSNSAIVEKLQEQDFLSSESRLIQQKSSISGLDTNYFLFRANTRKWADNGHNALRSLEETLQKQNSLSLYEAIDFDLSEEDHPDECQAFQSAIDAYLRTHPESLFEKDPSHPLRLRIKKSKATV